MMNTSEQTTEHDEEGTSMDDGYEEASVGNGCGCFRMFCFGLSGEGEGRGLLEQNQHKETWFVRKLKKVKEASELLAGPKWKNFIRRFGKKNKRRTLFQYSPQSYALNFDHGGVDDGSEEDDLLMGFSNKKVEERRPGL